VTFVSILTVFGVRPIVYPFYHFVLNVVLNSVFIIWAAAVRAVSAWLQVPVVINDMYCTCFGELSDGDDDGGYLLRFKYLFFSYLGLLTSRFVGKMHQIAY